MKAHCNGECVCGTEIGDLSRYTDRTWSSHTNKAFMKDRRNYTATSTATSTQAGLGALLQQIHRDLRIQHPEWVEANGDCPMCDSYEERLTELLDTFTRRANPESKPAAVCKKSDMTS